MFEKFLRQNAGDFRQRYRGTYGMFSREGKQTLVLLTEVNSDRGVVTFVDADNQRYSLNVDATEEIGFVFLPPTPAWHNTTDGAFLVQRVAARQFSRGICAANTQIIRPGGVYVDVGFNSLGSIFERGISVEQAMKRKNRDIAISPQLCVSMDIGLIYLFSLRIGKVAVSNGVFEVMLDDLEMFGTEVNDAFRRNNLEATVK